MEDNIMTNNGFTRSFEDFVDQVKGICILKN